MVPPFTPGSGGHAGILRIAGQLQDAGCDVWLGVSGIVDDAHLARQQRLASSSAGHPVKVRRWLVTGRRDVLVATSWTTAYDIYEAPDAVHKVYFVQDYEPLFYPAGSLSLIAAQTYSFGFLTVTLGSWLRRELRARHGVDSQVVDFGFDDNVYRLDSGPGDRDGVVFYARADTPRRCVEVGEAALALVNLTHPRTTVHLVGQAGAAGTHAYNAHNWGLMRPVELAALYNRCRVGLVLSATNVSLLPLELLACGVTPVVNAEFPPAAGAAQPYVASAIGLPEALAARLRQVLDTTDLDHSAMATAVAPLAHRLLPPQFVDVIRSLVPDPLS